MVKFGFPMKWVFLPALLSMGLICAFAQTNTSQKATAKTSRARSSKHRRSSPSSSYQLHPDAERYQEIQKALSDKGYFKGEVNGHWGDDSTDALKRFQADQKLEPDGKINSLTLIGLGLGPKHDSSAVTSSAAAPAAAPPAAPAAAPPAAPAAVPPASSTRPPQ